MELTFISPSPLAKVSFEDAILFVGDVIWVTFTPVVISGKGVVFVVVDAKKKIWKGLQDEGCGVNVIC